MQRIEPVLYRSIFKIRDQLAFHTQYEKENQNTVLNSLKCELLGTRDRNSLLQSLVRHLPQIGINTAGIALYEDNKTSLWVGGFSPNGLSPVREQSFSARLLVPESMEAEFSRGVFLVQPLFIENQSLGYFIHSVPVYDGVIFEELRSAVSYAFKGIFQLEEMARAIRIAEQAERAKTEFLRTLENELYDPLAGVMDRIDGLEKIIATDPVVKAELDSFKAFVASREEQAGSLIDLALSQVDELDPNRTLFDPEELPEKLIRSPKKRNFLFIGGDENQGMFRELRGDEFFIPSMSLFNETIARISAELIIFSSINTEAVSVVRQHPITVTVPIIMLSDRIDSAGAVTALSQYSRLIICHRSVASSPEFRSRLQALLGGDDILPPHTGALVKKTILYLDEHAKSHISRWKMAEAANVNEDYLTRIFHRETGLSLWDYLNRLRVYMAEELLLQTNKSIQEIAHHSGFQDHAYFCRVFKKIYGIPPGQLRKQ
jgi:AraC-like DNA-binding protein